MAQNLRGRFGDALTAAGRIGQQANAVRQMSEKSTNEKSCVEAGGTWVNGVCVQRRAQTQKGRTGVAEFISSPTGQGSLSDIIASLGLNKNRRA